MKVLSDCFSSNKYYYGKSLKLLEALINMQTCTWCGCLYVLLFFSFPFGFLFYACMFVCLWSVFQGGGEEGMGVVVVIGDNCVELG